MERIARTKQAQCGRDRFLDAKRQGKCRRQQYSSLTISQRGAIQSHTNNRSSSSRENPCSNKANKSASLSRHQSFFLLLRDYSVACFHQHQVIARGARIVLYSDVSKPSSYPRAPPSFLISELPAWHFSSFTKTLSELGIRQSTRQT